MGHGRRKPKPQNPMTLWFKLTDLSSGRIIRFGGAMSVVYDYDTAVNLLVRR